MMDSMEQKQGMQNFQYKTKEQSVENKVTPPSNNKEFHFSFSKQDDTDLELRKPRSRAYMEIFDAIDLLSATDEEIIEKLKENMDDETAEEFSEMTKEELMEEIMATFKEEFQKITKERKMLGVIAKCYIGGCDCHEISPSGEIVAHYSHREKLSLQHERARALLAKYSNCRCVEVYSDCCRVINNDSTVKKVVENVTGF